MSANFNWNTIPGLTQHVPNMKESHQENTDHFDDFFNNQIQQQPKYNAAPQLPIQTTSIPNRQVSQPSSQMPHEIASSLHHVMSNLNLESSAYSHSDDNVTELNHLATTSNINNSEIYQHKVYANSVDNVPNVNDSLPVSLTSDELTQSELKTYMRWYLDIQERKKDSKIVTLGDVFSFLHNFKIPDPIKLRINGYFSRTSTVINIGQFFAVLRLLAHVLQGKQLKRELIKIPAPVPKPIPILNKKRKEIEVEEVIEENPNEPKKKLDIDSFTEFILTGERPVIKKFKKNTNKKVKFSDVVHFSSPDDENLHQPPSYPSTTGSTMSQLPLDLGLPMNQLLSKIKGASAIPKMVITSLPNPLAPTPHQNFDHVISNMNPVENEEEVLKDVHLDTFKNVTNKAVQINLDDGMQPMEANLTGSASKSMKEHFMQQFEQTFNYNNETNSFNPTYANISALAADSSQVNESQQNSQNNTLQPHGTLGQQQKPSSQILTPAITSMPKSSSSNVTVVNPDATDYFGFVFQPTGIQKNNSSMNQLQPTNQSHFPSPLSSTNTLSAPTNLAPRPSSVSNSPPPVPPPPPISRKASRAASISNIPPPMPSQNPLLPPKPTLNEKQRKQYLSVNDEVNRDQQRSVSPGSAVFNGQYNMQNNTAPMIPTNQGLAKLNLSPNISISSMSLDSRNRNNGVGNRLSNDQVSQQQHFNQNQQLGYGQIINQVTANPQIEKMQRYNSMMEAPQIQQQQQRSPYVVYNQNQYNGQQIFAQPQPAGQQMQQADGNRWASPTPQNQPSSNGQLNWTGWNV